MTRLESGMSFLQVKSSRTMKEKLQQVRSAICVSRIEIAHTRLEAVPGAFNPYSLKAIFRRGTWRLKKVEQSTSQDVPLLKLCPGLIEIALKKYQPCTMVQKFLWTLSMT
jgi:hypothetical protein